MPRILKKKPCILNKKDSMQLPHCHNGQSAVARKYIFMGVQIQKVKVSHERSETEFGLQNHYGIIFIDQNPYIILLNNGILSQNLTNSKKNPH
jgi:hypothetical protein